MHNKILWKGQPTIEQYVYLLFYFLYWFCIGNRFLPFFEIDTKHNNRTRTRFVKNNNVQWIFEIDVRFLIFLRSHKFQYQAARCFIWSNASPWLPRYQHQISYKMQRRLVFFSIEDFLLYCTNMRHLITHHTPDSNST